jgi:hypothetical protein
MKRLSLVLVLAGLVLSTAPVAAQVAGDDPTTAIPVALGTQTYDSSAMTAKVPPDPTTCGDAFPGPFSNTMWFSYTATRQDRLVIADVNSFVSPDDPTKDFLAIVFVYAVGPGGELTLVGCSAYPATVTFPAEAGTTYLIMVGGLSAEVTGEPELSDKGGTFELTLRALRGLVDRDHFRATDTFQDEELNDDCGFPVEISFNDNVTVKTFFSADGTPRMFTDHVSGVTTFMNLDTGTKVTLKYARLLVDRFDGTIAVIGMPIRVSVGHEIVVMDVGKLVINGETGEVIFEGGHHPTFFDGFDLCGLLAG